MTAQMKEEHQVQMSFRVPRDLANALEQIARQEERTVSAELRRLVRQYIRAKEQEGVA